MYVQLEGRSTRSEDFRKVKTAKRIVSHARRNRFNNFTARNSLKLIKVGAITQFHFLHSLLRLSEPSGSGEGGGRKGKQSFRVTV